MLSRIAAGPDSVARYGDGPEHVIDLWQAPESPRALIVLVHGGFWRPEYDRIHTYPMAAALRDVGYAVASVEYRRLPGTPDATVADVKAALSAVAGVAGHAGGPVIVVGHSAGGHLALWSCGGTVVPGLAGVVALAPVADLELAQQLDLDSGAVRDFLGTRASRRADLDPVHLPAPPVRTVILHGERDEVVPIALAESYRRAHPETCLARLANTGHFAMIDPESPAWPYVLAELDVLARPDGARPTPPGL